MSDSDQDTARGKIGEQIFEQVQALVAAEGITRTEAFQRIAELRNSRPGTVSANYYRIARRKGDGALRPRGRNKPIVNEAEAVIERAIEDEYAHIQLSETRRDQIRAAVRAYVATLDKTAEPERQQVTETLTRLAGQEKKLLQAHYADHITDALFAEEQQRIRRERIAAEQRQAELQIDHGRTLGQFEVALSLTDCVQAAYVNAEPQTRRLFNQAIFARIWIKQEAVSDTELASPFGDLLADDLLDDIAQITAIAPDDAPGGGSDPQNAETLTALLDREGSNVERMVRQRGLEPPRP